MPKKKKDQDQPQQLSLFEMSESRPIQENQQNVDIEPEDLEELSSDAFGFTDEETDTRVEISRELITLKLLREAIAQTNPNDPVMADFSKYVLPNLLRFAIGVTAKGGKWFDKIDRDSAKQGKNKVRRDNAGDQSLNTHLLNGLFPVNLILKKLLKLNTTARREIQEFEWRILIASLILHDFEKFKYYYFSLMLKKYLEIQEDINQDILKLSKEEHREILRVLVEELALDRLLFPDNPSLWEEYLDDILYIAYNTQKRYGTNLNLSDGGLDPKLKDRTLNCLTDLTCLADRLASIIKHPQDADQASLQNILHQLSDGQLHFTYHSIAENRGVLTNVVNNAVMESYTALNTPEIDYYTPLLYLPAGIIYLALKNSPPIAIDTLPNRVVESIKNLCMQQLQLKQTGFGRDGKGMKYAEYYSQFFDDVGVMKVALKATLRIVKNKNSTAQNRSDKLLEFQKKGGLSKDYDFGFGDDLRIDQLAEFGDLVTRKIWGDRLEKMKVQRKLDKTLPSLPTIDLIALLVEHWQLENYLPAIRQLEALANDGGVPYEWYFLAAKYLEHNPGVEDIRAIGEDLIAFIAEKIRPIVESYPLVDGWDDLRHWVNEVVMIPNQEKTNTPVDNFVKEFNNYNAAKKEGRGKRSVCSISHSPYTVTEQMESAVLFAPQVYTNRQKLQGSNAKRHICSIAGTEIMLRQILMNQTQTVGGKFEEKKYRYLYFYPTYFFTPETNNFLQKAYDNIAQTRFDISLRNHFITKELTANLERSHYQKVDSFLIDNLLEDKQDRTFKLSYPDDKPLTFYFMALPPGKDPTDTESWVMPTWLAFAFPMILDVKTVVSESPIPPYRDGAEFEETVFLDGAPQAFRALTQGDRFRLDYILEGWTDDSDKKHTSPLNSLTVSYAIHLDVNAKQGKGGYNPNWGKLTELATNLETSPLYVFHYLKQWTRGKDTEVPGINRIKLYVYDFYPCFDAEVQINRNTEEIIMTEESLSPLNHPLKLTGLYREFYRANKSYNAKANAILKPLDVAADTLLKADNSLYQGETLVMVVAAEISKLMDRVHANTAEGRWKLSDREKERQKILDFARYFVEEVFQGTFKGDRARLAGRQLNLLRDTCEFLYRLAQDKENQERKAQGELVEEQTETNE